MKPAHLVALAGIGAALLWFSTRASAAGSGAVLINGSSGPGVGYVDPNINLNGVTAGYRNVAPGGVGGIYNGNPFDRLDWRDPAIIWN